ESKLLRRRGKSKLSSTEGEERKEVRSDPIVLPEVTLLSKQILSLSLIKEIRIIRCIGSFVRFNIFRISCSSEQAHDISSRDLVLH
ncbi:unnamed protein product, partial (mitochondrion) [Musa textilis]